MPVIPPVNLNPRETVTNVLNVVRGRLSDKMPTLFPMSGKVLDEYQATTQALFNAGYRRLQNELADSGVEAMVDETVIVSIPPTTNFDPSSQCSISFTQFFDGHNYLKSPVLPQHLLIPLWMAERASNTALPFPPVDRPNMRCYVDGLPSWIKQIFNGAWEWRNEMIFFPGATQAVDFRIRFRCAKAFIDDVSGIPWFQQQVPLLNAGDALAWWTCYEFAVARAADGDASEAMAAVMTEFKNNALRATTLMVNQTVMKNERINVRQRPYGGNRGSAYR